MKTSFSFAAAMTAVLAQSALALDKCNYAVVAPQLHSLGPEITACHEATGYYLAPPPAPPTAAQQQGICSKCTAFITKVKPMVWPECTLTLAGTDQTLTAFFNSVISPCEAPPTAAPTTSAPTSKPTDAPTAKPTDAPVDGTKPPAPTTPTTTPPTSC